MSSTKTAPARKRLMNDPGDGRSDSTSHRSSHKKISVCVESVIPNDRTFTTVDIMTTLEALDPGRVWRKRSVDSHISRLRDKGLVKRLRKSRNTLPAVYVRAGVARRA